MSYTIDGLEQKILEMYPELGQNGVSVSLVFDEAKNAYVVKMHKGGHEMATHLERQDADDCMNGVKCVSFGIQIEQFFKNFALREKA